jgi:hypothetical protein
MAEKIIARETAIKIAQMTCPADPQSFIVYPERPNNCRLYSTPLGSCWYAYAPWQDGLDGIMLRSSRVIAISKKTGAILYDGSANDEG